MRDGRAAPASKTDGRSAPDPAVFARDALLYQSIAANIVKEDTLIQSRTSYAAGVSAALVAALALLTTHEANLGPELTRFTRLLVVLICLYGLSIALAAKNQADAAGFQIGRQMASYRAHAAAFERMELPQPFLAPGEYPPGNTVLRVLMIWSLPLFWAGALLGSAIWIAVAWNAAAGSERRQERLEVRIARLDARLARLEAAEARPPRTPSPPRPVEPRQDPPADAPSPARFSRTPPRASAAPWPTSTPPSIPPH